MPIRPHFFISRSIQEREPTFKILESGKDNWEDLEANPFTSQSHTSSGPFSAQPRRKIRILQGGGTRGA